MSNEKKHPETEEQPNGLQTPPEVTTFAGEGDGEGDGEDSGPNPGTPPPKPPIPPHNP